MPVRVPSLQTLLLCMTKPKKWRPRWNHEKTQKFQICKLRKQSNQDKDEIMKNTKDSNMKVGKYLATSLTIAHIYG